MTRKHCMRCGKLGIRADSATEEIWVCPDRHGEIFRAPLPAPADEPPPVSQMAAPAETKKKEVAPPGESPP